MSYLEYAKVDKVLYGIARKLFKLPYLPTNLEEEKAKFLNSSSYNPVFTYKKEKQPLLDSLKKVLLSLEINSTGIGIMFQKKKEELLNIVEMMSAVGTREFTEASKELYGVPSPMLVQKAWRLIGLHDTPDNNYVSSEQVCIRLQIAMKRYGFDWKVKEKDMASRAAVSPSCKTLFIRKHSFFTSKFINRIIVHEIGTHILRSENGAKQPFKIFSLGLTRHLATEEGLAVVNEEEHNCLTRSTLKTYAARVIAVHKALQCTFRETYNYLCPYIGKQNAFEITLRAKRGVGNTFFPGAFTKDYLYLKGYFDVRRYLDAGNDISKLYYGKISLEDIPLVERIHGVVNPLFLPHMKYYTAHIKYGK